MTSRRGIVTGGTWCVDDNKVLTHWPEEDGMAEVLSVERHGGGSGCNLAIDIKRLDREFPVETISVVADDDAGQFLMALADEHGIDHRQFHIIEGGATHITDAYVSQRTQRRTHIYRLGSGKLLSPDHFDFEAATSRILHAGLPGVHELLDAPWQGEANGWVAVLKKAQQAGLKTNLELASIEASRLAELALPCLPHLDYIIVNDTEIGALSGIHTVSSGVTDFSACERAAARVMELGSMELVVVHCPAFAIALSRDSTRVVRPSVAVPKSEVVGANGAGDAFAAGMLYGIHEGWSLHDAVGLAHASAATSLRSISTTDAVENWRECLALADKWGWHA